MTHDRLPAVIVGTAPSSPGARPWDPRAKSTIRLARLARCEPDALGRYFGLANLVSTWPGAEKRPSDRHLRDAARSFAFVAGFRYVLAGSEVVAALGRRALPRRRAVDEWAVGGPPLVRWYESREGVAVSVVPHPSGRTRWYNKERDEDIEGNELTRRERLVSDFLASCAWRGPTSALGLWRASLGAGVDASGLTT